jgi:hypothetical protein
MPVSRHIDCYSLAKISEILADAKICDVFCMAGWYNKPIQCGRDSPHKSRVGRCIAVLGDCMRWNQHLLGDIGDHQRGLGEVSCCALCRAKQFRLLVSC